MTPAGGVPLGTGIEFDPTMHQIEGALLLGGVPRRVLRLGPSGVRALAELRLGTVRTADGAALARRLIDAGLAHPRPARTGAVDATVLVPAYGRAAALEGCLRALGDRYPVVVVDDGSPDPAPIAEVAKAYGARLIRRDRNGGPGAARNTGLAAVSTDLVALLDSDCVPPPDWIDTLAGHLADPAVAVVAPRIVAAPGAPAGARNALDLGPRPGRIAPGTPVAYVPTAALLVRRAALREVAAGAEVFDAALRYGEDVDLVWRVHAAGWRLRYEPAVRVEHVEPATWAGILARRFRYGSSAAALSRRHPDALAPLILEPWTAAGLVAVLARRPVLAALVLAMAVADERRARAGAGVRVGAVGAVAGRTAKTWRATGTYATQFLAPALLVGLAHRRTRFAAAAMLAAGPAHAWWTVRPPNDRIRFVVGHLAEDAAYGAGVLAGSARERTLRPLLPVRARRASRGILESRSRKDSTHGQSLVRDGR